MSELILAILGGLGALAAAFAGMWKLERGKRQRAESRAESAEATVAHGEAVRDADQAAEASGAAEVEKARETAREGGRRDHFES